MKWKCLKIEIENEKWNENASRSRLRSEMSTKFSRILEKRDSRRLLHDMYLPYSQICLLLYNIESIHGVHIMEFPVSSIVETSLRLRLRVLVRMEEQVNICWDFIEIKHIYDLELPAKCNMDWFTALFFTYFSFTLFSSQLYGGYAVLALFDCLFSTVVNNPFV